MYRKKIIKKSMSILVSILLILSVSFSTFAIDFNGQSGSGGQNTTSSNGYAITDSSDNVCGYRFTLVNSIGKTVDGTNSLDVLCSNYAYANEATAAQRFTYKMPKTWWISNYNRVYC